jgi:hypothetical protein
MSAKTKAKNPFRPTSVRLSKHKLNAMIEEATVDAHDLSEQASGFFSLIEERIAVPFETSVLGLPVIVENIQLNPGGQIVALCSHASLRQAISLIDLPLPAHPPPGVEWIEAYRLWLDSWG